MVGVAQWFRAPGCGPGCRGFKSRHSPHFSCAPMLENDSHNGSCEKRGANALFVQGSTFTNTAAKFWSSLIDEVHSDHPQCDTIVLDTLTDKMLSRELLFPQASLQYELDRHMPVENVRQALRQALADFDLIGPPDSVHVRLLSEDVECKRCDLPFD